MAFSSRRGRPRTQHLSEERDRGTPELQGKRAKSLTTEGIDLLLQKGQITPDEHWCALHFRWLYTLRYGAAGPKSLDPARIRGIRHFHTHEEWQAEREQEWHEATTILAATQTLSALLCLVIFNEYHPAKLTKIQISLSELAAIWCGKNTT